MDNFVLFELVTDPFLDFCNHIVQVSVGNCAASTGANLNHKDGVDLSVMLLIRILIPVITFHLPFIGGSLQNSKLIVLFRILRIGNDNTILQQTGCAYFRRGYLTSVLLLTVMEILKLIYVNTTLLGWIAAGAAVIIAIILATLFELIKKWLFSCAEKHLRNRIKKNKKE